jgi:ABC-type bacteriocin/lantibiotic exporter with double-glycine peptidase domain
MLKELVRPRRGKLALGFLLMLINRPAGLVLPGSTKFLVDNVIMKHQTWMLQPLVLLVLAATSFRVSPRSSSRSCFRRRGSA